MLSAVFGYFQAKIQEFVSHKIDVLIDDFQSTAINRLNDLDAAIIRTREKEARLLRHRISQIY